MMKSKKCLFLLPFLLVGCNSTKPSDDGGGKQKDENCYIKEDTTIDFLCLSDSSYSSLLEDIIEEFQENEPHVTVRICNPQGLGKYGMISKTVFAQFFEGDYPDLVQCYPDDAIRYLSFKDGKYMVNLDKYLNHKDYGLSVEDKKDYIASFVNEGNHYPVEGTYSLPFCKSSELMYYNADVLIDLDLSSVDNSINGGNPLTAQYLDSLTWEELFNKLAPAILTYNESLDEKHKIIDTSEENAVFTYDSDENFFITLAFQYGYGYTSVNDGVPSVDFNNQEMRDLMQVIKTAKNNHYLHTNGSYGNYVSNLFTARKNLFTVSSTAGLTYNYNADDPFSIGVARIPHAEGKEYMAINQGPSVCVLDHQDENRSLASYLLWKHMTNKSNSLVWALKTGYSGIRNSNYTDQQYIDALTPKEGQSLFDHAQMENLKKLADVFDKLYTTAVFNGSSNVRTNVGNLIKGCLNLDVEIDKLFDYYASVETKAIYSI